MNDNLNSISGSNQSESSLSNKSFELHLNQRENNNNDNNIRRNSHTIPNIQHDSSLNDNETKMEIDEITECFNCKRCQNVTLIQLYGEDSPYCLKFSSVHVYLQLIFSIVNLKTVIYRSMGTT